MLTVTGLKVRSLDVDFLEISWKIEDTHLDVLDFTFQVLRSESANGPWEEMTPPFSDQYLFFDRISHPFHNARLLHYLLRVTNRITGEAIDVGPASQQAEPDLIGREIRRHMNLLFREFTGRRCWILPVRTFGQRCFLPGTPMQGAVVGASRALYRGQTVQLTTKEGRRLTVTANHPVLTSQGFTSAQAVRVGDYLVCYGGEVGGVSTVTTQGHEQYEPALSEEVFRSLSEVFETKTARAVGLDFHGEAQFFDSDVEVVGSYGNLLAYGQPPRAEQLNEIILQNTHAGDVARVGLCPEHAFLQGLNTTTRGSVGRAGLPLSRFQVLGQEVGVRRFGQSAQADSPLLECVAEATSRNAELPGKLIQRGAGLVALDEVVEVRVEDYFGHVFDFETLTGWIVASDIFTSNCTCWNSTLQKRTRSGCRLCYDTGFVRGYHYPIETFIQIDPGANQAEQNQATGPTQQMNTTARLSEIGIVKPRDLLIEPENRRWRVTTINQTEQVRSPVHLELTIHQIPSSDIEYAIELKLDRALRDLVLSPSRNFTNPQNLDNFEQDEIPGIFSLYPTTYPDPTK